MRERQREKREEKSIRLLCIYLLNYLWNSVAGHELPQSVRRAQAEE